MRKYILPLLGLYLDYICIDTVVGLATYFFGEVIERLIEMPISWAAQASIAKRLRWPREGGRSYKMPMPGTRPGTSGP